MLVFYVSYTQPYTRDCHTEVMPDSCVRAFLWYMAGYRRLPRASHVRALATYLLRQ